MNFDIWPEILFSSWVRTNNKFSKLEKLQSKITTGKKSRALKKVRNLKSEKHTAEEIKKLPEPS